MAEEEKEVELDQLETKLCLTCKQDVPTKNFAMHEIHCKRFLMFCPHCKESVNKDYLDEHIEEYHAKVKCTDCKENVEKMELEDHKETHCRRRIVKCSYCDITLPACDIEEHKEPCGSRTEECETCKKRILIKDLELHISEGCQPPDSAVERNGTPSVNTRTNKPKSLYYDHRNNHFNSGGTGFQISSQFSYSTFMNHNDNHGIVGNSFLPESMRPSETVESQKSMQFPVGRSFDKKTSSNSQWVNRKPRKESSFGDLLEDKPRKTKVSPETESQKKLPVEFDELPEFGIPDQDSDDDMGTEAMKRPPELTDDTFLPCEFCKESFPADSLVVHQAMCQEMPPTPRPTNPTFFNRPPFNSLPVPEKHYSFLEQPQASRGTSTFTKQDIDDDSIPCEFCFVSFPVNDIAVHQTSCPRNPLYLDSSSSSQSDTTREQRRAKSPPPKLQTLPSKPKINPPALVLPETHTPEGIKVGPPRRSVTLAPTFFNKPTPSPSVTGAQPKIKPETVDNNDMERTVSKPRGGGKRGKNRQKPDQTSSRHFQEVHVLGGNSTHQGTTFEPRSPNRPPWEQDYFSVPSASRDGREGRGYAREDRGYAREGRGYARNASPSHRTTRSRGTRGDASSRLNSNGACTDSLDGCRGRARGSAGARRTSAGLRRGGQSRGAGTVTIPNRGRNPLNGSNSFMQRGRAGLQLTGRGFEGQRGSDVEGGWEGGSQAESRGGHRLGGSDARGTRGARGRNPRRK